MRLLGECTLTPYRIYLPKKKDIFAFNVCLTQVVTKTRCVEITRSLPMIFFFVSLRRSVFFIPDEHISTFIQIKLFIDESSFSSILFFLILQTMAWMVLERFLAVLFSPAHPLDGLSAYSGIRLDSIPGQKFD